MGAPGHSLSAVTLACEALSETGILLRSPGEHSFSATPHPVLEERHHMRSSILLCTLLVVGCAPAPDLHLSFSEADEASIRETYSAFAAAQETEEISQLGRFFTEDALWIPGTAAPVRGREAIQAWFTVRAINSGIEIQEVRGSGNLASVVATRTLTLDLPDYVSVPCMLLTVWEKQTDGSWLIARYASVCQAQPS